MPGEGLFRFTRSEGPTCLLSGFSYAPIDGGSSTSSGENQQQEHRGAARCVGAPGLFVLSKQDRKEKPNRVAATRQSSAFVKKRSTAPWQVPTASNMKKRAHAWCLCKPTGPQLTDGVGVLCSVCCQLQCQCILLAVHNAYV